MNLSPAITLVAVATVVIAGTTYLIAGSDWSTPARPQPHAINQNPSDVGRQAAA